jgi:zinc/manganese transport system permease protein
MRTMLLNINIITTFTSIFKYQFMQHAFEAGTIIAIVAGAMGYLVILRRTAFAAHAYAEIGFAGAAGAILVNISPIIGMLAASIASGFGIAVLGRRATYRDVEIGTILAFALGLGLLFISLYTGYATEAYSILFGEILGISWSNVILTLIVSACILVAAAFVYRPLLFASLDEDVAEAKGMRMVGLGIIFMVLLAASVSIAVQISGVLLIFALMVTPAATAIRLTKKPAYAIATSIAIALIATWSGLLIAFYEPYPVSFFIVTIVFALYLIVRILRRN